MGCHPSNNIKRERATTNETATEDKSKNKTKKGRRIIRQKRRTKNESAREQRQIKDQDKEGKKTNLRRIKMRRTRNTYQPNGT